jgi:protein gp37
MSDRSAIEWTDASWNPLRVRRKATCKNDPGGEVGWHCEHVSEGCRNCYAETINRRLGTGLDYKPGHRADIEHFLDEKMLLQPLHWKKPRKIFVGSMTDLFGDWVTDAQLDRIFAVMALCPQHTFQVLTKRPERMRAWFAERWQGTPAQRIDFGGGDIVDMPAGGETGRRCQIEEAIDDLTDENADLKKRFFDTDNEALWTPEGSSKATQFDWPLPNVWLGVSCEDQATADERIPLLLDTPAAVRFVSAKPMLGAIMLPVPLAGGIWHLTSIKGIPRGEPWLIDPDGTKWSAYDLGSFKCVDWVIVGGESGPNARPMHPDWARSLRDQCKAAGVAFFFKQWGEWAATGSHNARMLIGGDGQVRHPRYRVTNIPNPTGAGQLIVTRVGKKRAGRLLDGVEHNGMPEMRR